MLTNGGRKEKNMKINGIGVINKGFANVVICFHEERYRSVLDRV